MTPRRQVTPSEPGEFRKTWSARLPVQLIERMHEYSYVSRVPLQEIVELALQRYLDVEYPVSEAPRPAPPASPAPPPTTLDALRADLLNEMRAMIVEVTKKRK